MRIGLPILGMLSHILSPTRRVLLPFSLAGAINSEATLSTPFLTVKSVNSFFAPEGSMLMSFR